MVSKEIARQYFDLTLPLCKTLGDIEYFGVEIDNNKINRFRDTLIKRVAELTECIRGAIGTRINIESNEELKAYLLSSFGFSQWQSPNRSFTSLLEYLGINHAIPRLIVQYRRLMKEMYKADTIINSIRDDKVYPTFNQVKSKSGSVTAKQSDIFDTQYLRELSCCFNGKIHSFFQNPLSGIIRVETLSCDEALKKDMHDGQDVNIYLSGHPAMKETDSNSLFLSIITDMPDSKVINRFLIDERSLSGLRKELESRYNKLYSFLNKFKATSLEKGFSEVDGRRKYLIGLKSPNLEKRLKAVRFALKWLIEQ